MKKQAYTTKMISSCQNKSLAIFTSFYNLGPNPVPACNKIVNNRNKIVNNHNKIVNNRLNNADLKNNFWVAKPKPMIPNYEKAGGTNSPTNKKIFLKNFENNLWSKHIEYSDQVGGAGYPMWYNKDVKGIKVCTIIYF